jgi:hypothetical protein
MATTKCWRLTEDINSMKLIPYSGQKYFSKVKI